MLPFLATLLIIFENGPNKDISLTVNKIVDSQQKYQIIADSQQNNQINADSQRFLPILLTVNSWRPFSLEVPLTTCSYGHTLTLTVNIFADCHERRAWRSHCSHQSICRDKNKWKSTDIIIPVATSLNNNEVVQIDICQTIGKAARRNGDINDLTCYFLDRDQFSKNDNKTRKESVISTFAIASAVQVVGVTN